MIQSEDPISLAFLDSSICNLSAGVIISFSIIVFHTFHS